jgi:hypothetical protein
MNKEHDIILDMLWQECGIRDSSTFPSIDNHCLSCYEFACHYLKEKGYLTEVNPRIYHFTNKGLKLLEGE